MEVGEVSTELPSSPKHLLKVGRVEGVEAVRLGWEECLGYFLLKDSCVPQFSNYALILPERMLLGHLVIIIPIKCLIVCPSISLSVLLGTPCPMDVHSISFYQDEAELWPFTCIQHFVALVFKNFSLSHGLLLYMRSCA